MKTSVSLLLFTLFFNAASANTEWKFPGGWDLNNAKEQAYFICRLNQERSASGLPLLGLDYRLSDISRYLVTHPDNSDEPRKSLSDLLKAKRLTAPNTLIETLYVNSPTDAVDKLLHENRSAILDAKFTKIGVGHDKGEDDYVTALLYADGRRVNPKYLPDCNSLQ